jgi:uncharacterized glyoxalase superfamily protein PhnB
MVRVVPMLHVPDVQATADWYERLGFTVVRTVSDGAEVNWALLRFGESDVMLSAAGKPSEAFRRDADLYIHVEGLSAMAERIREIAEVVEDVHETFYGQRELIVRDCNRFWVTFGEPA